MILNVGDQYGVGLTLKKWWDGLEWQDYQVPDLDTVMCNGNSLINEAVCYANVGAYQVSDTFMGEWFYKMAANAGMHVRMGIDQEFANLGSVVKTWIGL